MPMITFSHLSILWWVRRRSFINAGAFSRAQTDNAVVKVKKKIKNAHPSDQSSLPADTKSVTGRKAMPVMSRITRNIIDFGGEGSLI